LVRRATFALVLLATAAPAAVEVPPRPDRYATDRAGVVEPARLSALNETLAQFERETSNQVIVYVERALPAGASIEDFASAAFRAWKVGQADRDNGAVFFVFVDDRQTRIEVGYGLEGVLPDIRAASIIEDYAKPRFRANDFAGGTAAAAEQIMRAARGEPYQGTGRTRAETGAPDGPVASWYWLVPLVALAAALGNARSAPARDRWLRGAVAGGIVAVALSLGATFIVKDGRFVALGFGFLLLAWVPVLGRLALQDVSRLSGRRALGRRLAFAGGGLLIGALGILCFAAVWSVPLPVVVYASLAGVIALAMGGLLYASDPVQVLTFVFGRLAIVVLLVATIFLCFCVVSGATTMVPDVLAWMVPSGLVALACTILAHAKGWRLWPRMQVSGGHSGSGYSSDSGWSSSGSSDSGSSFSGGGGDSGGGGASGSW
jgi:uncharacterized protein